MCDQTENYIEFPAITVGGTTGSYVVTCPTTSCQWAEYCLDTVVNGDGGTSAMIISGNSAPPADLDYSGASTAKLTDGNYLKGVPIRIPATSTQYVNSSWERITNSEKKVYVRINAAASTSMYLTLRFRVRLLKVVPGPAVTTHPDNMQALNNARADAVRQRLGLTKEINTAEATITATHDRAKKEDMLNGQR